LNHDGPFILFETGGTNREPLYRCRTSDIGSGGPHLFSRTQGCDGRIDEGVLGYVSTVKTTETPRRLLACKNETANVYFHWLSGDTACPAGSVVVGPPEGLGYVK
jgi:hypothetical protein